MNGRVVEFIDVDQLRIGHYVFIDLGWISHPFPLNSFRIQSDEQIRVIRSLGIQRIRYSSQRSIPVPDLPPRQPIAEPASGGEQAPEVSAQPSHQELLADQRASLEKCERLFSEASSAYRQIIESAQGRPEAAREATQALIDGITGKINGEQESCIRLLSEKIGERSSLHAINVTVISLLLGKACGLDDAALRDVGIGALLHDIGKARLPERLHCHHDHLTASEQQVYREHVRYGLEMVGKMNLPKGALLVIGQHHEAADGSGYPLRIGNDRLSPASRVVCLVNRYDKLCNPDNPAQALTPHEAMSNIFAQRRGCFDEVTLGIFVRMMGVYPPGSVVELSDARYAMVVSVNASRPLKPSVIIHDEAVPREEARVVHLWQEPTLGIRRSLRPLQLPKATFDYLSPSQRVCYFFEHGRGIGDAEGPA